MVKQIIRVPLTKIIRKKQVREQFDEQVIRGIAESISTCGQLQPAGLMPVGDMYELIYGEQRYLALEMAGETEIDAIVHDATIPESEKLLLQLTENLNRQNLNPVDAAKGISALIAQTNYTAELVAAKLGLSPSYISKLLSILKLPSALQDKVRAGTLSLTAANGLSRVDGDAEQLALAAQLENGLTRDELVGAVKRKKASQAVTGVKPSKRVAIQIGQGRSIILAGAGISDLATCIDFLQLAIKKVRAALPRGIELITFVKLCRDEAKADAAPPKTADTTA